MQHKNPLRRNAEVPRAYTSVERIEGEELVRKIDRQQDGCSCVFKEQGHCGTNAEDPVVSQMR